jgi:hypothetical protein
MNESAKTCKRCGSLEPLSNFHKCAERKDGLHPWCKPCARAYTNSKYPQNKGRWQKTPEQSRRDAKRYYERNPEKCRARSLAFAKAHPEKVAARKKLYRATNRTFVTVSSARTLMKRRYKISRDGVLALASAQAGYCAICESELGPSRKTHIDHDHVTGAVRGLLCHRCNTGLGMFRDDADVLMSAVKYLQHHASKARAA